jgi:rhamnosyltransferase subunit B
MPRVLLATTGSLGDLNPMFAIGEHLLALGADVAIATYPIYEQVCKKNGFRFFPIGGPQDYVHTLQLTRQMLEDQSFGTFVDRVNFDQLDLSYAQLLAAAENADILVAPSHVAPAHLVAEKRGIPYVACALCLIHIKSTAPIGTEEYKRLSASAARWHSTLRKFREAQQLKRKVLPFASLLTDATKVLGMLPSFLLSSADLRTPNLDVVGYAAYPRHSRVRRDDELLTFCDERTVAFSFGSFADACDPGHFFEESVAACRMLGFKCVYLSKRPTPEMLQAASKDVMVREDVSPAEAFPLVNVVVHHGGTGTLVAACENCKPMVIVPFFLDQPLQAARMQSLIGSPVIPAREYDRQSAFEALRSALEQADSMSARTRELMAEQSDGAERSAHRIMSLLPA